MTSLSISSQLFWPTSPAQISLVPGRIVNRNGLRKPKATIRLWLASVLAENGLPGRPAPVSGSIRTIEPSRPVGSEVVRASWLRSDPPSEVGGESAVPEPPGGSPQGLTGVPA